jgi:hypothetical protein
MKVVTSPYFDRRPETLADWHTATARAIARCDWERVGDFQRIAEGLEQVAYLELVRGDLDDETRRRYLRFLGRP